ncbi:MAG: hypothetical protein M1823_005562 [Watsoniomyces obsoletus]|nr:MAG: hypothetical protein M1823_005562 [Watsoniomyces obsoletus]
MALQRFDHRYSQIHKKEISTGGTPESAVLAAIKMIRGDLLNTKTIHWFHWCWEHNRPLPRTDSPWTPDDHLITIRHPPPDWEKDEFEMALEPVKAKLGMQEGRRKGGLPSQPGFNMHRMSEWAGCLKTCAEQQVSTGKTSLPDMLQACSKQSNCQRMALGSTSKVNLPQLLSQIWEQNKPTLQKVERDQNTLAALAAAFQMAATRLGRVKAHAPV